MPIVSLQTPEGKQIRGTVERVPGCALARTFEVLSDGSLDPLYEGETDLWWDEQETVTENGERIYLDDDGDGWPESNLLRIPAE